MNIFTKITVTLFTLLFINFGYSQPSKIRLVGIQDMTKEMTLVFEAHPSTNAKVYYDIFNYENNLSNYTFTKSVDESHTLNGMHSQIIRLKNLLPNRRYYFVLADNTGVSSVYYFETLPDNNSPISLIAGSCSDVNRIMRTFANIMVAKLSPHAVIFDGDFTGSGSYNQWSEWFDDWQYSFSADGRITPIIPARGNQESNNDILKKLFGIPSTGYYNTKVGKLLTVYTLNSEDHISNYAAQSFWLNQALLSNTTPYKIVQYHKSIRPHTTYKLEGDIQYNYWTQIFEKHNIDLAIESDVGTLKQTWPISSCTGGINCEMGFTRDDDNGIVYVGDGGWGSHITTPNSTKLWTRAAAAANQFKWIFVKPESMEVRTVLYENALIVGSLSETNRFSMPNFVNLWNPPSGDVIYIKKTDVYEPQLSNQLPYQNQTFVNLNPINFSVEATQQNGSIDEVAFYINQQLIGKDFTPPFQLNNWQPQALGTYSLKTIATNNSGKINSSTTTFQVREAIIVDSVQLNNTFGDAEEQHDGKMDLFNWDLDLGYNGYTVGFRFTDANIPPNAIVTKAYIQFTADEVKTTPTELKICAEKTGEAASFKLINYDISSRVPTQNYVNWKLDQWYSAGISNKAHQSPDLSNIINEIIGLNNYSLESPLLFMITGIGHRVAKSTDGAIQSAPILFYEYYIKNDDDCMNNMVVDTNSNLNELPLYCKSFSTTGNLLINQMNKFLIMASDSIELNGGVEINSNSNFTAIIKSCY